MAGVMSMSAMSNPSLPYVWELSSVPSGRTTAEVGDDPAPAQFNALPAVCPFAEIAACACCSEFIDTLTGSKRIQEVAGPWRGR